MTPINNSDTAWLIVSDYNQDNDLSYEELREDILNPNVNGWDHQFYWSGVGSEIDGMCTGGGVASTSMIEDTTHISIGDTYEEYVGGGSCIGGFVGGSPGG
jgi:hypothetical protein